MHHFIDVDPPKADTSTDGLKTLRGKNTSSNKEAIVKQEKDMGAPESVDDYDQLTGASKTSANHAPLAKSGITIGKTFDMVKKKGRPSRKSDNQES